MEIALRIASLLALVNTWAFMAEASEEGANPGLIVLTLVGVAGATLCWLSAPLWAKGIGAIALAVAPGYFYPLNAVFFILGVTAIVLGVRRSRRAVAVSP